jgi:tetratricopeptide (TPR) repeat protein
MLRARAGGDPNSDPSAARRRWNAPIISYGLFFILVPLAPALNINGVGENVFTERYLYLPSVGFVMLVAVAWQWLAGKQRVVAWAAVAVIVAVSAWILLPRNLDWRDDMSLFKVTAEESPKSAAVAGNLGWLYYQRGEYDLAIQYLLRALQLQPELWIATILHDDLANAYTKKGRYQDALDELHKAIAMNPAYAEAHWHLGMALESRGDIPGALAEYKKAVEISPNYAEAYTSLALLRMNEKDYPAAIDLFQRAIKAHPHSFEAWVNLGVAYNNSNRYAEGAVAFRNALEAGPDDSNACVAHYNLGMSYAHLNSPAAAILEFEKALQLKPDFTLARDALTQMRGAPKP